jgi:hypothetical protein
MSTASTATSTASADQLEEKTKVEMKVEEVKKTATTLKFLTPETASYFIGKNHHNFFLLLKYTVVLI